MNNNFGNIDKATIDAARRGDKDAVFKNLTTDDRQKLEQILNDKNKLQQILNSDAARQLIKFLNGDKKNG